MLNPKKQSLLDLTETFNNNNPYQKKIQEFNAKNQDPLTKKINQAKSNIEKTPRKLTSINDSKPITKEQQESFNKAIRKKDSISASKNVVPVNNSKPNPSNVKVKENPGGWSGAIQSVTDLVGTAFDVIYKGNKTIANTVSSTANVVKQLIDGNIIDPAIHATAKVKKQIEEDSKKGKDLDITKAIKTGFKENFTRRAYNNEKKLKSTGNKFADAVGVAGQYFGDTTSVIQQVAPTLILKFGGSLDLADTLQGLPALVHPKELKDLGLSIKRGVVNNSYAAMMAASEHMFGKDSDNYKNLEKERNIILKNTDAELAKLKKEIDDSITKGTYDQESIDFYKNSGMPNLKAAGYLIEGLSKGAAWVDEHVFDDKDNFGSYVGDLGDDLSDIGSETQRQGIKQARQEIYKPKFDEDKAKIENDAKNSIENFVKLNPKATQQELDKYVAKVNADANIKYKKLNAEYERNTTLQENLITDAWSEDKSLFENLLNLDSYNLENLEWKGFMNSGGREFAEGVGEIFVTRGTGKLGTMASKGAKQAIKATASKAGKIANKAIKLSPTASNIAEGVGNAANKVKNAVSKQNITDKVKELYNKIPDNKLGNTAKKVGKKAYDKYSKVEDIAKNLHRKYGKNLEDVKEGGKDILKTSLLLSANESVEIGRQTFDKAMDKLFEEKGITFEEFINNYNPEDGKSFTAEEEAKIKQDFEDFQEQWLEENPEEAEKMTSKANIAGRYAMTTNTLPDLFLNTFKFLPFLKRKTDLTRGARNLRQTLISNPLTKTTFSALSEGLFMEGGVNAFAETRGLSLVSKEGSRSLYDFITKDYSSKDNAENIAQGLFIGLGQGLGMSAIGGEFGQSITSYKNYQKFKKDMAELSKLTGKDEFKNFQIFNLDAQNLQKYQQRQLEYNKQAEELIDKYGEAKDEKEKQKIAEQIYELEKKKDADEQNLISTKINNALHTGNVHTLIDSLEKMKKNKGIDEDTVEQIDKHIGMIKELEIEYINHHDMEDSQGIIHNRFNHILLNEQLKDLDESIVELKQNRDFHIDAITKEKVRASVVVDENSNEYKEAYRNTYKEVKDNVKSKKDDYKNVHLKGYQDLLTQRENLVKIIEENNKDYENITSKEYQKTFQDRIKAYNEIEKQLEQDYLNPGNETYADKRDSIKKKYSSLSKDVFDGIENTVKNRVNEKIALKKAREAYLENLNRIAEINERQLKLEKEKEAMSKKREMEKEGLELYTPEQLEEVRKDLPEGVDFNYEYLSDRSKAKLESELRTLKGKFRKGKTVSKKNKNRIKQIEKALAQHNLTNNLNDLLDSNVKSANTNSNISYSPEEDDSVNDNKPVKSPQYLAVEGLINQIKNRDGKNASTNLFSVLEEVRQTPGFTDNDFKNLFDHIVTGYKEMFPGSQKANNYTLQDFEDDLVNYNKKPLNNALKSLLQLTPKKNDVETETPQISTQNNEESNEPETKIEDENEAPTEETEANGDSDVRNNEEDKQTPSPKEQNEKSKIVFNTSNTNKSTNNSRIAMSHNTATQGILPNIYTPKTIDKRIKSQKVYHTNLFDFKFVENNLDEDGKIKLTYRLFEGTSDDTIRYKNHNSNKANKYEDVNYVDFVNSVRERIADEFYDGDLSMVTDSDLAQDDIYAESIPIGIYAKDLDGKEVLVGMLNDSNNLASASAIEDENGNKIPFDSPVRKEIYENNRRLREKILHSKNGLEIKTNIEFSNSKSYLQEITGFDKDNNPIIRKTNRIHTTPLSEEPESTFENKTMMVLRVNKPSISSDVYNFTDSNGRNVIVDYTSETASFKTGQIVIARQTGFTKDNNGKIVPRYSIHKAEMPRTDNKVHQTVINIIRAYAMSSFNRADLIEAMKEGGYRDPEIVNLIKHIDPPVNTSSENLNYAGANHYRALELLKKVYRVERIGSERNLINSDKAFSDIVEKQRRILGENKDNINVYKASIAHIFNAKTETEKNILRNKVGVFFDNHKIYIYKHNEEGIVDLQDPDNFMIINPFTIDKTNDPNNQDSEKPSIKSIIGKLQHLDKELDKFQDYFDSNQGASTTINMEFPSSEKDAKKSDVVFYSRNMDENGEMKSSLETIGVEEYAINSLSTPHTAPNTAVQDLNGKIEVGHTDHNGNKFTTPMGYYNLSIETEGLIETYNALKAEEQLRQEQEIKNIEEQVRNSVTALRKKKKEEENNKEADSENNSETGEESSSETNPEDNKQKEEDSKEEDKDLKDKLIRSYQKALKSLQSAKLDNSFSRIQSITSKIEKIKNAYSQQYNSNIEDDISYSPEEFDEDKFDEMNELISQKDFSIPELNILEKQHLLNYIFHKLSSSVASSKDNKINLSSNLSKIEKDFKDKVQERLDNINREIEEELEDDFSDEIHIENLRKDSDKYSSILNNIDNLVKESLDLLANKISLKKTNNTTNEYQEDDSKEENKQDYNEENSDESDDFEEESASQLEKDYNSSSLEEKGKVSLSSKMKRFLTGIPVSDKDGNTEVGFLGLPKFYDFKELDNFLKNHLNTPIEIDSSYEAVINKLNELSSKYSWAEAIKNKLEDPNTSQQVKNEFLYNYTGKHSLSSKFIMFSFSKNGLVTELFDTNFTEKYKSVVQGWKERLRDNTDLYEINEDGNLVVNITEVENLIQEYDRIVGSARVTKKRPVTHKESFNRFRNNVEQRQEKGETLNFSVEEFTKFMKESRLTNGITGNGSFLSNPTSAVLEVFFNDESSEAEEGKIYIKKNYNENNEVESISISTTNPNPENSGLDINLAEELQLWLDRVGIDMSAESIAEIGETGIEVGSGRKKVNIKLDNLFTAVESPVYNIRNQLEAMLNKHKMSEGDLLFEDNNLFKDISSRLNSLAKLEVKYSSKISTKNFKDNGKLVSGLPPGKFATDRVKALIEPNSSVREDLSKTSFNKNSLWLKILNKDLENFSKVFGIHHIAIGSMKKKGSEFAYRSKITQLNDTDLEINKLSHFYETNNVVNYNIEENVILPENMPSNTRIANIFVPTMSDKDQMMVMRTLVFNFGVEDFNINTGLGANMQNLMIDQLVIPEIFRMYSHARRNEDTDIEGYDMAAQLFNFLPMLNTVIVEDNGIKKTLPNYIKTKSKGGTMTMEALVEEITNPESEIGTAIRENLNKYMISQVKEKIKYWDKNDIINRDENGDIEYLNINRDFKQKRMSELETSKGKVSQEELAQNLAADFIFNNMISNANMHMTIIGDPALYSKNKPLFNKDVFGEDSDPTQPNLNNIKKAESIYRAWSEKSLGGNLGKRLALMIAPGNKIADSKGEVYYQVFLSDQKDIASNIASIVLNAYGDTIKEDSPQYKELLKDLEKIQESNKILSKEEVENVDVYKKAEEDKKVAIKNISNKFPEIADYLDIESTDAQEYATVREHLHIMKKQGRLSDDTYNSVIKKIEAQNRDLKNKGVIDPKNYLSKSELKTVMQPIKPVYTGQHYEEHNDVMRTVYIKSSSFPLLPQLTIGNDLDGVRRSLEKLEENLNKDSKDGKYIGVRASYSTANKVGNITNPLQPFKEDGTFNENGMDEESVLRASMPLDRNNFRIQQDVPYKDSKDKNTLGTQMMKVLFANGVLDMKDFVDPDNRTKKISGRELFEKYNQVFKDYINIKKEQLYLELGLDKNGNLVESSKEEFYKKLEALIQQEGVSRGYSNSELESLKLSVKDATKFQVPVFMNTQSGKIESMLISIITNRISKHKLPGHSYVAGSEAGFKKVDDLKLVEGTNRIIYTKDFLDREESKGQLKGATYDNGDLKEAEVLLPSKFRDNKGNLLDLFKKDDNDKYIYVDVDEKTGNYTLKEGMIEPFLRSIPTFRIPTSSHVSLSQVKIVGFLPPESGDLIVVPKNFTKQKGLDFDIDKENTYSLWTYVDKDNKVKELTEERVNKVLEFAREKYGISETPNKTESSEVTETSKTSEKTINIWYKSGENSNLSNLALRPFVGRDGRNYHSVEHYYQTNKTGEFDEELYKNENWKKPGTKIRGKGDPKTTDDFNINLMKDGIKDSFRQNPEALKELLNTRDAKLTHTQDRSIWGKEFPNLLEQVRDELKIKVQTFKSEWTRKQVEENPDKIFLFGDNIEDKGLNYKPSSTQPDIDSMSDSEIEKLYEKNREDIERTLEEDLLYQLENNNNRLRDIFSEKNYDLVKKFPKNKIVTPKDIKNTNLSEASKKYLLYSISKNPKYNWGHYQRGFGLSYKAIDSIKELDKELENILINKLKELGYTISESSKQELKEKYGYSIKGVFDVAKKHIDVANEGERSITTLPEEAIHAIIELSSWRSSTKKKTLFGKTKYVANNSLTQSFRDIYSWSEYNRFYKEYKDVYLKDGQPDETKIKKEILAKAITYALTKHKDFDKYSAKKESDNALQKVLKDFVALLENLAAIYRGVYENGFDRRAIRKEVRATNFKRNISSIAKNIRENNFDTILEDVERSSEEKRLTLKDTLESQRYFDNGFAENLVRDISNMGGIITGSLAIRYHNDIYRKEQDSLHDIDLYIDVKKQFNSDNITEYRSVEELENSDFFKKLQKKYPQIRYIKNFGFNERSGKAENGITYQYVIPRDTEVANSLNQVLRKLQIDENNNNLNFQNIEKELDKLYIHNSRYVLLDIFTGYNVDSEVDPETGFRFVSYSKVINEKLRIGRTKDSKDYYNTRPYEANSKDSNSKYYQISEEDDKSNIVEYKRNKLKEYYNKLNKTDYEEKNETTATNKVDNKPKKITSLEELGSIINEDELREIDENENYSNEVKYKKFEAKLRQKLLENKIVNINSSVLTNPNVQPKITKVLSMAFAESQAEKISSLKEIGAKNSYIKEYVEQNTTEDSDLKELESLGEREYDENNKYFSILSDSYQSKKLFLGSAGQSGIGIYSNYLTASALMQQYGEKGTFHLKEKVVDDEGKTHYNAMNLTVGEFGTFIPTFGRLMTLDGSRSISDVFEELQNTATDNEKAQIMGRTGINDHTIGIFSLLSAIGIDKTEVTGAVAHKFGINHNEDKKQSIKMSFGNLLLSQDIVNDFVMELSKEQSNATNKKNKVVRTRIEIINSLINREYDKKKQIMDEKGIKGSTYISGDILTGDNLVKSIGSSLDEETQIDINIATLELMLSLEPHIDTMRDVQKVLSMASKGLGKDFLEAYNNSEFIKKTIENKYISGIDKLLFDTNPVDKFGHPKEIEANTPYGEAILDSYRILRKTFDEFYPYKLRNFQEISNAMLSIAGIKGSGSKKTEFQRLVIKEYKKYLNAVASQGSLIKNGGSIAEERKRLFQDTKDNMSLASYLFNITKNSNLNDSHKDIIDSKIKNNPLISRMYFNLNSTKIKKGDDVASFKAPSLVGFNDFNAVAEDVSVLETALLELLEVDLPLPDLNGEKYSTRKLVRDLVLSSILRGGQHDLSQFSKYIPVQYLEVMGFNGKLRDMFSSENGRINNSDVNRHLSFQKYSDSRDRIIPNSFMTQFFQHYPEKIATTVPKEWFNDIIQTSLNDSRQEIILNPTSKDFNEVYPTLDTQQKLEFDIIVDNDPTFIKVPRDGINKKYVIFRRVSKGRYERFLPKGYKGISEYTETEYEGNLTFITSSEKRDMKKIKPSDIIQRVKNKYGVSNNDNPSPMDPNETSEPTFDIKSVKSEDDLNEIIYNISNSNNEFSEDVIELAKNFNDLDMGDINFVVQDMVGNGMYNMSTNTITINKKLLEGNDKNKIATTILKELTHAFVNRQMAKYFDSDGDLITKKINPNTGLEEDVDITKVPKSARNIAFVYKHLRKHAESFKDPKTGQNKYLDFINEYLQSKSEGRGGKVSSEFINTGYGLVDIYEFMEMSLTNPKFREFIEELSLDKSSGKNFKQRAFEEITKREKTKFAEFIKNIKDFLKDLFKFTDSSLDSEKVVNNILDFISKENESISKKEKIRRDIQNDRKGDKISKESLVKNIFENLPEGIKDAKRGEQILENIMMANKVIGVGINKKFNTFAITNAYKEVGLNNTMNYNIDDVVYIASEATNTTETMKYSTVKDYGKPYNINSDGTAVFNNSGIYAKNINKVIEAGATVILDGVSPELLKSYKKGGPGISIKKDIDLATGKTIYSGNIIQDLAFKTLIDNDYAVLEDVGTGRTILQPVDIANTGIFKLGKVIDSMMKSEILIEEAKKLNNKDTISGNQENPFQC